MVEAIYDIAGIHGDQETARIDPMNGLIAHRGFGDWGVTRFSQDSLVLVAQPIEKRVDFLLIKAAHRQKLKGVLPRFAQTGKRTHFLRSRAKLMAGHNP